MMYHDVRMARFEIELAYLKSNGYESIGADALLAWMNGDSVSLPVRPIVLTFDDAHLSLWTDAYPLLKRYGYSAIVFAAPLWIPDSAVDRPRPNARHPLRSCASWEELREMETSGVIDVQSHTYSHDRIWVGPEVCGFVAPDSSCLYIDWDGERDLRRKSSPPLGWPLLGHASRFGYRRSFIPEPSTMRACAEYVATGGGREFFRQVDWNRRLRDFLRERAGSSSIAGVWETSAEHTAALRDGLKRSKRVIEERLEKRVEHLAFPWNEASTLATSLAVEEGYRSLFRGRVNNRDVAEVGDDPLQIPRVNAGGDLQSVLALPGRGRRGPVRTLVSKTMRAVIGIRA